ncbi:MAG: hypothetical protein JOZ78_03875, partial [Chroococcidiopsidaceae cyanobacterium CP_BM_ER_R8_30]|nr:hypothetical protein [Chroococcidiopsidaceae cyanobacterium CP_BM_ER_R8_30]
MPAASSGPYQSRIFNFVHQKSRRVSEQIGRTIRHLRVATSWGVQVMLYPIYLLFQTTESAEKRFYSSQQNWRQLPEDELDAQPQTPPATDQAIQRVLHIVKVLPSEALAANPLEESTKPLSLLASLASNSLSRFKFLVFPSPNYPSTPASHHLTTSFPPIQGVATQL